MYGLWDARDSPRLTVAKTIMHYDTHINPHLYAYFSTRDTRNLLLTRREECCTIRWAHRSGVVQSFMYAGALSPPSSH